MAGSMQNEQANNSVPVIMLTARDLVADKIQAFELGADDYIVNHLNREKFWRG
jgi:two-component system response regulator CiaR